MFEHTPMLMCRLCRKSSGSYVDIYNPKGTRGLIVWKVIKDLIQLDVCKEDILPNTICDECMDKVVEFRNFKAMCINSRIEFLKASVNIGLVENELQSYQKQSPQKSAVLACASVVATSGDQGWSDWMGNPLEQDIKVQVQNDKVPQEPANGEYPDVHDEAETLSRRYMEPRLDESIGSLKSCDAPNCRKVFSSYKALVIHKRAKHSDVAVSQRSGSLERVAVTQTQDCVHVREQGGGICIEEFSCEYPSCCMVFSNLSSLLIHQTVHPPTEDGSRLGSPPAKRAKASENYEVVVIEEGAVSSGSELSDDQYIEELQSEASVSIRDELCRPSPCEIAVDVESVASHSNSSPESPLADSIPKEPEFLCHWEGCGMGFHSFDRLLQHKKQKHRGERADVDRGKPHERNKHQRLKRELDNLRIDMSKQYPGNRKSHPWKTDDGPKHNRRAPSRSSLKKKKAKEESAPSTESLEGAVKCAGAYLCAWSGCHLVFGSSRELHKHQAQYQHGRGRGESREVPLPEGGSRSSAGERSTASNSSASIGQVCRESVGSSSLDKNEMTGNLRIKEEPMTNTVDLSVDESTDGELCLEDFECDYPGCNRSYSTFSSLLTHYSRVHRKKSNESSHAVGKTKDKKKR